MHITYSIRSHGMEEVSVAIIGAGTAATNAARAAKKAGAERVLIVHNPALINTCVEEGCMPSKSLLAGAHKGESLETVEATRNAHIERLRNALLEGFAADAFEIVHGHASFKSAHEILVSNGDSETLIKAESVVIATGSHSFVPPIAGLDTLGERLLVSEDVVSIRAKFDTLPQRILVIGAGPIGLELSTVFHDLGSQVDVLQRGSLLRTFDPEFGIERLRASKDNSSFPIHCNTNLIKAEVTDTGVNCTIEQNGVERSAEYDYVLVATGRKPNTAELNLEAAGIALDERGNITHDDNLATSAPHIFVAGDVTGHHQILHYAAEMGKVAGHNAAGGEAIQMEYDRHMLAVSFDQFPSALIGLTETEATRRGMEVVTATRCFNSIGLGILKRQEYGMWKLVAEAATGRIVGAQVLGPDSAGELVQLLVPILANDNTADDIMNMTWYHPTYAEILLSLARDICKQDGVFCPGST